MSENVLTGISKMVSKLLLVGPLNEESRELQHNLNRNKLYSVERVDDSRTAVHKMKNNIIHLVMFNLDVFNEDKLQTPLLLRRETYDVPVLMLAKAISQQALDYAQSLTKMVVLEKPFEGKDLYGITSKLLGGREVSQRVHRRFYTKQNAQVESIGDTKLHNATMLNLSKGGAYLELRDTPSALDLRGIVKMSVPLGDLNKKYEVNAKVVWSSPNGMWGTGHGLGLQFIQAKDVYRNLLNNL